jgi:hypothetical protein
MMNCTDNIIKRLGGVQKAKGRRTLWEEHIIEMMD